MESGRLWRPEPKDVIRGDIDSRTKDSRTQGLKDSRTQGLKDSRTQGLKDSSDPEGRPDAGWCRSTVTSRQATPSGVAPLDFVLANAGGHVATFPGAARRVDGF